MTSSVHNSKPSGKPCKPDLKMAKAVNASTRVVAYLPSLRTILQRLRATTTTPSCLVPALMPTQTPLTEEDTCGILQVSKTNTSSSLSAALQNSSALIAARLHPQFPLPGAIGLPPQPSTDVTLPSQQSLQPLSTPNEENHVIKSISDNQTVEFMVQECPLFLHSELMRLFPGVTVSNGGLTVITLSEKTIHDMSGWSQAVEEEREQLLEHFIDSAKEICSRLTGAGCWSDFIDPSSGRAFYSPYSSATLFETDERFRYLGFDITDLGCCKCIHHPVFGAYTFVGTIFTDAPAASPVIRTIMEL